MQSRITAQFLALILVLAQSTAAPAQTMTNGQGQSTQPALPAEQPQPAFTTPAPDWQDLRGLQPGKKVLVEFKSGSTLDAKFVRINGSQLTLSEHGSDYNLEQRDIRRIYRLKGRWSRGAAAKVGAAIGILAGTFIGTGIGIRIEGRPGHIPSDKDTGPAVGGFIIGALAGAGVGALLGGKRRGKLLYEAQ
jgi:hypothetical protein